MNPVLQTLYPLHTYVMRREGRKQYGFYHSNSQAGASAVRRYHCSHHEAQRRFETWWTSQRLTR
jgi:hypothetical protein